MIKRTSFAFVTLLCAAFASATLDPAESFSLSPIRIADLKTVSFLHKSVTGLYQDAGPVAAEVIKIVQSKNIAPTGGLVLVFKNPTADLTAKVSMEIGVPVAPGTKAPDGYQVSDLEAQHCATTVFTGNMKEMGPAIAKFVDQVKQGGNDMAGPIRERILYWEDEQSDNNIVLIEIPLQSL